MSPTIQTVSSKGQIVIPSMIRSALGISQGMNLVIQIHGDNSILLTPVSDNPVLAARGILGKKSGVIKKMLAAKRQELKQEDKRGIR